MDFRDQPFKSKIVMFGGDFGKVVAVVRRGSRGKIIDATLPNSME